MLKVALQDVRFYAYHGYYPEEQILGGNYLVDVEVWFVPKKVTDELQNTVDYQVLHSILSAEMKNPRKLLETVVQEMINQITQKFPFLAQIKISLKKLNPPLPGEVGYSLVEITWIKEA